MKKILLILLILPCFGWAQTVTIRPNGAGTYANGAASTGQPYECVDETSANGDTDYIYDMYLDYSFVHTASGLTSETISNVKFVTVAKIGGGTGSVITSEVYVGANIGGSAYYTYFSPLTSSYVNYEADYPTNPATGLSWTVSDIAGMELGTAATYETSNFDSEARITQLYAIVTYTGGGGGSPTAFPTKLLLQGTGK